MIFRILIFLIIGIFVISNNESQEKSLVNSTSLPTEFSYEIRYATIENFMNTKLYECDVCLLQAEVAQALAEANQYFCEMGYRINIYDCYRPLDVQKEMWKKVPNDIYVANPYEGGSVHNSGAAVDITLVTLEDCFVDMGTDYDYFGREAHIDYYHFPEPVLENRKLLSDGMKKYGFKTIQSEWWHFSYLKNRSYPIMNEPLPCEVESNHK